MFFSRSEAAFVREKQPSGTQGKVTPPKAKLPPLTGVESGESREFAREDRGLLSRAAAGLIPCLMSKEFKRV